MREGEKMITMGDRINAIRRSNNMNQNEFAKLIGVSQGTLSELEQGKYNLSIEVLINLKKKLNVDLDWFLLDNQLGISSEIFNIHISDTEMQLLSLFRKIKIEDQKEILEFVEFKLQKNNSRKRSI
jgi:transcriptional regulator with XRE-family HTH domain